MEDYIVREIDRIGEMLMQIAKRLGLFGGDGPSYDLDAVQDAFAEVGLPFDLDAVLQQENPILYLVEHENISVNGLETFIDIIFHSDMDEARKQQLLRDAMVCLESRGQFSFKLHSYCQES